MCAPVRTCPSQQRNPFGISHLSSSSPRTEVAILPAQPALRTSSVQMSMSMDRRDAMKVAAAAGIAIANVGAANAAPCDNGAKKCTVEEINKDAAPIVRPLYTSCFVRILVAGWWFVVCSIHRMKDLKSGDRS